MRVTNINGTSPNTCKCGNWLEHWKNYGRQPLPRYCPEKTCMQQPEVGAHVQKEGSPDRGWYIVPLCRSHNGQTGTTLEVSDNVALVSANVGETCGRGW